MKEANKEEVERAKKALSKMDPELVMMAIRQADIDFNEVDRIKDFLSKCNPDAVQYAVAEINQDLMTKEIKGIQARLKGFTTEAVAVAAIDLGFAAKVGLCMDPIHCHGRQITIMARCRQDMYVRMRNFEDVINPEILEGVVNRAVMRAFQTK